MSLMDSLSYVQAATTEEPDTIAAIFQATGSPTNSQLARLGFVLQSSRYGIGDH